MKKIIVVLTLFFSGFFFSAGESEVKVIKEPTPLFSGMSNAKTLVLEKSIEELDDKELKFFASVQFATVDKSDNYYLFDFKHGKIIKLDREFKFVCAIGGKGEGPGEFRVRGRTPNIVSIGLDENLYLANWQGRRIFKYSLDGKYISEVKYQQFVPFKVGADERGTLYLPSIKEHIIDVHDSNMNYKKSLIPLSELKTFLFIKPPPCVTMRFAIPGYSNIQYEWLSTKELAVLNKYDLSITIINTDTGKIKKKFYAWDDYVLSEYKIKIKEILEKVEKMGVCGYVGGFGSFFIDDRDYIYLQFLDSQRLKYLYKFSREGVLQQMYKIDANEIEGLPKIFHLDYNNRFIAYSGYGIHVFKEQEKAHSQ